VNGNAGVEGAKEALEANDALVALDANDALVALDANEALVDVSAKEALVDVVAKEALIAVEANDALVAVFANDAVPNKLPVIPFVTVSDPVTILLFCAMTPLRATNSFAILLL
jgi:hypothetical protein